MIGNAPTLLAALLLGLAASGHCLVMCGGISAALGIATAKRADGKPQRDLIVAYQFGRITSLQELPGKRVLGGYIRKAIALNEAGTQPARKTKDAKPKPPAAVPDDLAAALKKNRKAAAVFDGFSNSNRREYIEWITEAKREETRSKRLAQTLEWLEEGKPRNWKYMPSGK